MSGFDADKLNVAFFRRQWKGPISLNLGYGDANKLTHVIRLHFEEAAGSVEARKLACEQAIPQPRFDAPSDAEELFMTKKPSTKCLKLFNPFFESC